MMKNFNKYMFLALAAGFTMTACESDDEFQAGVEDSASKAGAYFTKLSSNIELEPSEATEATFTVSRLNTQGALSFPIQVVKNQDDVFTVPATVDFADGEAETTVSVSFDKAEIGNPYTLTVQVPEEYMSLYKEFEGYASYSLTVSRVKWEPIGTCYWVDGIISTWYGVTTGPFAVKVDKAETPSSTKYRFNSPYAHFNPQKDAAGIGYLGYIYSDVEYDEQDHPMIITVTGKEATLAPVQLGATMDPEMGMINTGSILGNLSDNTDAYKYGALSADGSKIVFPANSLYVNEPAYGTGICSKESALYFKPDELMIPDEFQPVGYGFYDYAQFLMWPEYGYADFCFLELCRSTEDTTQYRIDAWDLVDGEDFYFTVGEDNVITFDEQYAYYDEDDEEHDYVGLGEINVSNFVETNTYFDWDAYEYRTDTVASSYYDPEADTFMFNTLYSCEEGVQAVGFESFQMYEWYSEEEDEEEEPAAARKRSARRGQQGITRRPVRRRLTNHKIIAPRK